METLLKLELRGFKFVDVDKDQLLSFAELCLKGGLVTMLIQESRGGFLVGYYTKGDKDGTSK